MDSTFDMEPSYLLGLNPPQREAVEAIDGPLLVLAGAGTGKTRVLTTRIAHILNLGLAKPYDILAVTFTNKAAQEMKARIAGTLQRSIDGMWLGTFHALCVRILRSHAEAIGFTEQFTILDTDDQTRLIKQITKAEGLDEKEFPVKMITIMISRWKDKAYEPENVPMSERGVVHKVYEVYQRQLRILNAMDFGDLLLYTLKLFKENPQVLKSYQMKFRYILVDEYQDTNSAQYLWLRLLAMGHQNICCVGDDDQSIYGWRGAEVGNILKFEADFPGAFVVKLEQNYRSTSYILEAASGLIAKNKNRLGKTLWTDQADGEKVVVQGVYDSDAEARYIGHEIEDLQRKNVELKDIAVLVRAGFQTREHEECYLKLGIPYKVIGGQKFYERQEIRDAIAYIRLLMQPDDALAFERIVNVPRRGIGQTTLQSLHVIAREQETSLPRVAFNYAESPGKGAAKDAIRKFFEDIYRWRQLLATEPHVEVVKRMLDESGYTSMWMNDKSPDSPGRLENLKELIVAIEGFEYLQGFLEHVSLVMDNASLDSRDQVTIMTLHAAKGLEYDYVFLTGWEEGIFPNQRALDDSGSAGLEEERRLGYVGISRAKIKATITHAARRRMYKGFQESYPSRFIKELPDSAVVHLRSNGRAYVNPKKQYNSAFDDHSLNFDAQHQSSWKSEKAEDNSFLTYGPKKDYILNSPVWNKDRPAAPPSPKHSFKKDNRVFHQKFGYGTILNVEGDYLEISFDHSTIKKVIYSFVDLA
jgi:DNA helicase-2/ATP-dependent DNA helicase PcrA